MSLKTSSEIEKNKVELSVIIEKDSFAAAVEKAYKKNVGKISVPGFRKGKAPKGIIEKFYGKTVFYEDALNDLLPTEIDAAVKETGFVAADTPAFENVDFENEEGVLVKVTFLRVPDVTLGEYKGIEAVKTIVEATDKDVDAELEKVRVRYSRTIDVTDRAAQKDDTVVIDYAGSVDGVPFEGGKADGHKLKLGSNSFIPGFEDQIVGKNNGDEFDVNVTFPEEYHAEELKGKAAVFQVKLNSISFEELPTLDDEFAKDASEFDTLNEYKADLKAKIEKKNSDEADHRLGEDIAASLCDLVEADIPEVMFEKEIDLLVREYDYNLRNQGFTLEMFMQYTGMKIEDLRERYRKGAVINVKKQLALNEISKLEKIEVLEGDLEKRFTELAEQYNMKVEEIKAKLPEEDIKNELAILKAFEVVKNSAKITERTISAEEFAKEAQAKQEAEEVQDTDTETDDKPKKAKKTTKKVTKAKDSTEE